MAMSHRRTGKWDFMVFSTIHTRKMSIKWIPLVIVEIAETLTLHGHPPLFHFRVSWALCFWHSHKVTPLGTPGLHCIKCSYNFVMNMAVVVLYRVKGDKKFTEQIIFFIIREYNFTTCTVYNFVSFPFCNSVGDSGTNNSPCPLPFQ